MFRCHQHHLFLNLKCKGCTLIHDSYFASLPCLLFLLMQQVVTTDSTAITVATRHPIPIPIPNVSIPAWWSNAWLTEELQRKFKLVKIIIGFDTCTIVRYIWEVLFCSYSLQHCSKPFYYPNKELVTLHIEEDSLSPAFLTPTGQKVLNLLPQH